MVALGDYLDPKVPNVKALRAKETRHEALIWVLWRSTCAYTMELYMAHFVFLTIGLLGCWLVRMIMGTFGKHQMLPSYLRYRGSRPS